MLDERQKKEIEIYAGIEPISWDVGVSRPVEDSEPGKDEKVESELDNILSGF